MSSSNSSLVQPSAPLGQSVSEKLTRENYILWKTQVLVAIRGARLDGFLDGSASVPNKTIQVEQANKTRKEEENPAYTLQYAQDQQVLSFLLNSVTKEVLGQIAMELSASGAWRSIVGMFAS
jgi:hypothetical protein